jgi:hypothetical protein
MQLECDFLCCCENTNHWRSNCLSSCLYESLYKTPRILYSAFPLYPLPFCASLISMILNYVRQQITYLFNIFDYITMDLHMGPVTRTPKLEHTHWRCKKVVNWTTRQRCNKRQSMSDRKCVSCGVVRVVGSEAEDNRGRTLGVVRALDDRGEDLWDYYKS